MKFGGSKASRKHHICFCGVIRTSERLKIKSTERPLCASEVGSDFPRFVDVCNRDRQRVWKKQLRSVENTFKEFRHIEGENQPPILAVAEIVIAVLVTIQPLSGAIGGISINWIGTILVGIGELLDSVS